ncbi:MAG: alanine racemase [Eubacteriales bacterium]|nr:alanine racemase [Eubacteriales bacterium]
MDRQYPQLEINLPKLRRNTHEVVQRCQKYGITVCGVIKGANGHPDVARAFLDGGATELGTSRIEQVIRCREAGVPGPYLLLRVPMLSELEDVVRWCDTSLQSEVAVLDATEEACQKLGKTHRVIVMADLGDLREGFWDKQEMVRACVHVEQDLPHVHLAGIGVNLGCYGSIQPMPDKMEDLVAIAREIESKIGRKLEVISGGATSSYTLVHWDTMPDGINHLRIGEGILNAKDLQVDWGIHDMKYLCMDAFTIRAQVLEVKTKPSHPVGTIVIDAFCRRPTYVDRGMRKRCLLGIGHADVGDASRLIPRLAGAEVLGGSSDHCILDIEECEQEVHVGDILEFSVIYSAMMYAIARNDMHIIVVDDQ